MTPVLYLDTSAVLRAVLERGLSPEIDVAIAQARYLLTSRLSFVEAARALLRLRVEGVPEVVLASAAHELESIWARCAVWELTREVTELAAQVAPRQPLRTLDALHLATYLMAQRSFGEEISLLTADGRLAEAASVA